MSGKNDNKGPDASNVVAGPGSMRFVEPLTVFKVALCSIFNATPNQTLEWQEAGYLPRGTGGWVPNKYTGAVVKPAV